MFCVFTQPCCPSMVCIGGGNASSAALSALVILESLGIITCGRQYWMEGSALMTAANVICVLVEEMSIR